MSRPRTKVSYVTIRRNRPFLRYWLGNGVSQFGDQVSALALPFMAATMLDASPVQVGTLTAAVWAPNLLSLFLGTWVDQHRHHQGLLIVANLSQSLAVAAVPLALLVGHLSLPVLYAVALVLGAGGTLYDTSYPGFFARLVPKRQYVAANSLLSTTQSTSNLAGPALGGALIQVLSAPVAMVVDAASFLFSATMTRTVRLDDETTTGAHGAPEPFLRRLRLGATYLTRHQYLRASLGCSIGMNFAAFIVQALLVLYATRDLNLGAGQLGLALGIGAIGGLLGAATASRIARRIGTGPTIIVGAVLYCIPFAGLALANSQATAAAAMIALASVELVSGFGIMLFDINNNAVRTAVTRDDMRSRVSGAYSTVNYGIRPLGALAGGFLAAEIGIPATFVLASILGSLSVVWLITAPVIRIRAVNDL